METRQRAMFEEITDLALLVDTLSEEERNLWDARRISDALVRETGLERAIADEIAREVELEIASRGGRAINTRFIRELVNVKLWERGLERYRLEHALVGIPVHDLEGMILLPNRENSNTTHNPESINLNIAERVLKEYALTRVFSRDVAEAHLSGDIHLHDLGMINRPYCSGQSLEYLKKFGLNLPPITSISKPARHAEVLLAHLLKMTSVLQNHFAGAIGWDAVNTFFAPYLVGMSDEEMYQLAQMLVFEFNQLAGGRGGQVAFTDINLYYEVPDHFARVPAIGPGGTYTGKTYGDYFEESARFLKALFMVYLEGDVRGQPFFFPKPLLHITDKFFQTPGWEEMLELACLVASEKGNTYFVFDRGGVAKLSECCRLQFELSDEDLKEAATPWKMRFAALQNVTLNFPRMAYRARTVDDVFDQIEEGVRLAVKAHLQKKAFIEGILDLGKNGPLAVLCMDHDGEPYLRRHRMSYLVGILGINEAVQYLTGFELHESKEAFELGLALVKYAELACEKASKETGLKIVLEQTPAESTAYRFAKLDLKHFPSAASSVIKGDQRGGYVYYTNSTHFNYAAPVDPITRVVEEGRFHPFIKAGAITHVWMGDHRPDPKALASFVVKTFWHSQNVQVAFSPEFTVCNRCQATSRGLKPACPRCGSLDVDGITRITGYFTRTSSWNKGKRGELVDRRRVQVPALGGELV